MGVFHFESLVSPTQFNIDSHLNQRKWLKNKQIAQFKDSNLSLKDKYSTVFEYKHLLGELISSHCPTISPVTLTVSEENVFDVYQTLLTYPDQHIWILKPALLNNGVGIKLLSSPHALLSHYDSNQRYSGEHVVQAYIHPPHLLNGHKYSLRMFVILTSEKKAYLYQDGYFNVCRHPYIPDDLSQLHSHLTNEHLDNDSKEPNNYQISTARCSFFQPVYLDIVMVLKKLFKAFNNTIKESETLNNERSFILLGADFMLDEHLNTYLLEINHGPCFPKSKEHPLFGVLYHPFFKEVVNHFVLPIAEKKPINVSNTDVLEQVL